jgi:hypothetical protein
LQQVFLPSAGASISGKMALKYELDEFKPELSPTKKNKVNTKKEHAVDR